MGALWPYADRGCSTPVARAHLSEAHTVHSSAVLAAAQTQDRTAQAHALINLGVVALRLSRNRQAADHYRQALTLCRNSGDRFGELRAIGSLATVDQRENGGIKRSSHGPAPPLAPRIIGEHSQLLRLTRADRCGGGYRARRPARSRRATRCRASLPLG